MIAYQQKKREKNLSKKLKDKGGEKSDARRKNINKNYNKMRSNKLYTISLNGWKEKKQGFFLKENKDWLLIKSLFTDYIMDGNTIIHKKYIASVERGDKERFIEAILIANDKFNNDDNMNILSDTYDLLELLDKNKIVFQLSLKDETICYVGRMEKIKNKTFLMEVITPKGIWSKKQIIIRKDLIRTIDMNNDYINSLLVYNYKLTAKKSDRVSP
jgi:hypothetical protein